VLAWGATDWSRRRRLLAGLVVVVASFAVTVVVLFTGGEEPAVAPPARPPPERAERPPPAYEAARVTDTTVLRDEPKGERLAEIGSTTEFGEPRVVAVVRRKGAWLGVLAPELANGEVGWLRARDVKLRPIRYELRVDVSQRRLRVVRDGRVVERLSIAVGSSATPTPTGRFAVTDRLDGPRFSASAYGCCILAITARQTQLAAGWSGGDRIAFHAAPDPSALGQAVSNGCMRVRAEPMRKLMRTVPVGTPVFVRQ
jgi:lipoprotein-anchoring transpeptidase ErfK/SrfK